MAHILIIELALKLLHCLLVNLFQHEAAMYYAKRH